MSVIPDMPGNGGSGPSARPQTLFFIPATSSLHERRPRTLKDGDSFAVFDHSGDAIAGEGSPEGLYHRDTRYLSHLYLTINDKRPILLSSAPRDDNLILTCDLTNPDYHDDEDRLVLEHDLIHIRRTRFIWKGSVFERITVRNFDLQTRDISIELSFASDFADLFEMRGMTRTRRGEYLDPEIGTSDVALGYIGLDDKRRTTRFRFEPVPDELSKDRAVFKLHLESHQRCTLFLQISCDDPEIPPSLSKHLLASLRDSMHAFKQAKNRTASISSSHQIFDEATQRSVADIYMLTTQTEYGPYPYAGIPWFSTVFGRDAIITALQTLWLNPRIAHGVLGYLGAHQAEDFDASADAEPGKILHEVRYGEMAELKEVPFRHYYGSIDSTPLFVMLAGAYLERTGDRKFLEALWPKIEAALSWIDEHGDRDGDGFVEYGRRSGHGLVNQGWKDSHDSVFHSDGTLATGPIALAEVQAYVYGAWIAAANILVALNDPERAAALRARAEIFKENFDARFYDEKLETYVLALDGDKRPCRVRSSNAGHVLFTGLARTDRAASVVKTLMKPASFSGWGIRTIASTEARYNPMSYHNGSIWPHDNGIIAAGFSRYGYRRQAGAIFEGLFAASTYVDLWRLPELFCGFPRRRAQGPTFYPVACSPQAWAAGTPLSLIQSTLGLSFAAGTDQILLPDPALPPFLDSLVIRSLTLGASKVDLSFTRQGDGVIVGVLRHEGAVHLVTGS